MVKAKTLAMALALFVMLHASTATTNVTRRNQFNNFFPERREQFRDLLKTDCSSQYNIYLAGDAAYYAANPERNGCRSCIVGQLVECMFDELWVTRTNNMAAAGVLLGLLPTILTFTGTSTIQTGVLAIRRPILSLLLSAGQPVVNPLHTFDYKDLTGMLETSSDDFRHWMPVSPIHQAVCVTLEYVLAGAAAANVAVLTWQLGYWTLCAMAPETVYLPILWAAFAVLFHILGFLCLRLRLQIRVDGNRDHMRILDPPRQEFMLSGKQDNAFAELMPESKTFIFVNWCLSLTTVLHTIFGIVVLSGTMLISLGDALGVAAKYLASTVVCRIIIRYELNGLVQVVKSPKKPEDKDGECGNEKFLSSDEDSTSDQRLLPHGMISVQQF